MGYRNYLTVVKKDEFKKIDEKFLDSLKDDEGYLPVSSLLKKINGVEVYELGKYSDEGALLENIKTNIPEDLKPACEIIKKYADENEYGFNVLTKQELILCIESFKTRVYNILKNLLEEKTSNKFDKRTREERLKSYVQDKLNWFEYYVDLKDETLEQKFKVQNTWFYEYGIFDLIHTLKMVDWEENILIVTGW